MNKCIICGAPTLEDICKNCDEDYAMLEPHIIYKLSRAHDKEKKLKEKEIIENENL